MSSRTEQAGDRLDEAIAEVPTVLYRYTLVVIAMSVIIQLVLALTGTSIGWLAFVLTGAMAVAYFVTGHHYRDGLTRFRFGYLVLHAVTFVAVNGGFALHAFFLSVTRPPVDGTIPLTMAWIGPTFAMCGFWSIGFLIHALAVIQRRGFER